MAKRKTKIKKEVSNMEENNIETIENIDEETTEVQETVEEPKENIVEEPESEMGVGETAEEIEETTEEVKEIEEVIEEPIVESKKFGTVLPNKLNVRENPEKSANILEVLNRNDKVEILEEFELFYKIKINDTIGYCVKEFII